MREREECNNFTIISVHAPTEENKLVMDSLYDKLNQKQYRIPAHDTKITTGDFNAKIGKEEIFKPVAGNSGLHETSNKNGITATDFATNNNINKSTFFPHKNIHKDTCQSPDRRTNHQTDHVLVQGRHVSSIMDVKSCAHFDMDHHLVQV